MSERGYQWISVWEGVIQAGQVIRGYKMRSILLMVGVAIGVATLLAIYTIVTGLSGKIRDDVVSASRPYIFVARYHGMGGEDIEEKLRRRQIAPECIPAVAQVEGVSLVDYFVQNNDATILHYGKERTHFVQVFGSSENFPYLFSFTLGEGRFFTPEEVASRAQVCVLGGRHPFFHQGGGHHQHQPGDSRSAFVVRGGRYGIQDPGRLP